MVALLTLAAFGACLIANDYIKPPWEDAPAYHLRLLKWHGRETRDLQRQQYHSDALVALGSASVPCLVQEAVASGGGPFGERFSPSTVVMLKAIGEPAHALVLSEISASADLATRRALVLVNIGAFDDWSCFGPWLEEEMGDPSTGSYLRSKQLGQMQLFLQRKFGDRVPRLVVDDGAGHFIVDRNFIQWWRDDRVASGAAAKE